MKRIAAGAALLTVFAAVPVLSRVADTEGSRVFAVDGAAFDQNLLRAGDEALVDTLWKATSTGSLPPNGTPSASRGGHTVRAAGARGRGPAGLPAFLHAEHTFDLPAPSGRLAMATGLSPEGPAAVARRLERAGWTCQTVRSSNGQLLVGRLADDKKEALVLLEEEGRNFLFLQRVEN